MQRKKIFLFSFSILLVSIITFSCKKKKKVAPIISISPAALHLYANINDLAVFKINVSTNSSLSKVIIKGQPDSQTPSVLLDTAISSKGTSFSFYYKIPANLAGKSILITFEAIDEKGLSSTDFRRIYVSSLPVSQVISLTETSGHRMFSNLSTSGADAYNLETNSGEFSITADTASRDIQDFSNTSTTLSKSWISPAGGKFVIFNGYDYANATDSSAINAYTTGVKQSVLYNLAVGDIIITKLGSVSTNKYAVIRITDIVDVTGKDNDYYEFNIKK